MKKPLLRKAILLIAVVLFTSTSIAYAATSSIPESSTYNDALTRLTSLGIISDSDNFNVQKSLTREQFSKMIVLAAGLEDTAISLKGPTIFSDVASDGSMNGYINAALNKGYITGKADGKFHSKDSMDFATVCTAMIKVLGYTSQDVPGTWPKNYTEKAKALGITSGLTLIANSVVPGWAMVVMLDKLLDTNIKKANNTQADQTLAEASGLTQDAINTDYGKPEIYISSKVINNRLGTIDFNNVTSIVRNTVDNTVSPAVTTAGEEISISQINEYNVVYPILDKSGDTAKLLVIDNKITGTLKSILPNKLAPKSIMVDSKEYTLGKYLNTSKLNTTVGSFNVGDDVTLLLGNDGKVADIISAEDLPNGNFAFVINYSSDSKISTSGVVSKQYYAKLMLSNGIVKTYPSNTDVSALKGKLVTYKIADDGSVGLQEVAYNAPGEVNIDKNAQLLYYSYSPYTNYITSNVKIFNVSYDAAGTDTQVQVLNLTDLPSGIIQAGKILHLNKTGDFADINLIVANDISSDKYTRLGLVKSVRIATQSTINATILIDGKEYSYNGPGGLSDMKAESVVRVIFQNGSITSLQNVVSAYASSTSIQGVSAYRVRVNNINCWFKSNCAIYFKAANGTITTITSSQLSTSSYYSDVSVYFDKLSSVYGKAEVIVVKEQP